MDMFTKKDTSVVKGIAVLMLLCHHLGMGILEPPLDWRNDSLYTIVATLSKVCVAIFILLSGYGLNESHNKWRGTDFSFVKKHLFKLMKQFWFIYVIFVPSGFLCGANPLTVYGTGFKGFSYFALDFLGLKALFNTPTMNQTWWYMEAAIVLYILFPILKRLLKKPFSIVILLLLTFIPIVNYSYFCDGSYDNCREIFWIFPFICGILISKYDIFNMYSKLHNKKYAIVSILSVIFVLFMTLIRSYLGIIVDTVYAISIIFFTKAIICKAKSISRIFDYLGVHSANIFMMHSFLYCYYIPIKQLLFVVDFAPFNYLLLVFECIIVSDYLEITKKRLGILLSGIRNNTNREISA